MSILRIRDENGKVTDVPIIRGPKGDKGDTGVSVSKVEQTTTSTADGGTNVATVTLSNGQTATFNVKNGSKGSTGSKGDKGDKGDTYTLTSSDKTAIANEAIEKMNLSLGIASDGLIYLFVNGSPVGTGIPQGQNGDVFGYVDENNTIALKGNLTDGSYSVKYEMEDGSIIDIGELAFTLKVTKSLTYCSISNTATSVSRGGSYSATISANSGYEMKSIKVTMGGTDISSSAVSGNNINIANVTGDIVITAVAEVYVPPYTNLAKNFEAGRLDSSGNVSTSNASGAYTCIDYIYAKAGDIIYIKGYGAMTDYNMAQYDGDKKIANAVKANTIASNMGTYAYDSTTEVVTITVTGVAIRYNRFSGKPTTSTADIIITVNEPIV